MFHIPLFLSHVDTDVGRVINSGSGGGSASTAIEEALDKWDKEKYGLLPPIKFSVNTNVYVSYIDLKQISLDGATQRGIICHLNK